MWCWGQARLGEAGPPIEPFRRSPVQVGEAEWLDVAAGEDFTCALKLDGTRWCFGTNDFGTLGAGTAWLQQFTMIP